MKNISYSILGVLVLMMALIVSCTEEIADVRLDSQLSTSKIQKIGSDSAVVVGYVIAEGSGLVERGVCYSTTAGPTTDNDKAIYDENNSSYVEGSATATFNVTVSGLSYATKYYARAYAITGSSTIYGEELSFTTLPVLATVTTNAFTPTSGTTAEGSGSVINAGGADVTARGVCYSTTENPTIEDYISVDGNGTGDFVSSLTGLSGLTTYYVRAYATNSAGTAYGEQVSFTTPKSIVTLWVAGAFQGWNPSGATDSLMNTEANSIVQGYVYFPSAGEFKIVSQKNWDGPNYGAGDPGFLSTTGGNLSVPSAGYYLFKVNMDDLSYTQTKADWGVIGSATADGWGSDQNMTYSSHFKRWFATIPLTAQEAKFRANDAWDLNYGDNGPDGKLEEGGDNIAISSAGTYSAMLTLSKPAEYTYAFTQWGIIGSATAGGWDNDTNMTPGANNTWTITTNLTVGDLKFRANDGWSINLGGTTGSLSWDGPNLSVGTAGNYTITLDLVNGTATLQLN